MASVSLPKGATNVGTNNWSDVYNNDNAIVAQVNGALDSSNLSASAAIAGTQLASGAALANLASASVTDAKIASPNNSVYTTILGASGYVSLDVGAGTYFLGSDRSSAFTMAVSAGGTTTFTKPPEVFYFDDADYTVAGLTQKLRLRCQVAANATAPAINFTFGLYPVTVAGGADTMVWTAGTVVPSSTQAINAPSASTVTQAVNSDFTIPVDGAYVLAVLTSGVIANNSVVSCHAQLQTRNV